MLLEEFVKLTGYRPNPDEYDQIESNYMVFDGDKQAFCKAWVLVNSNTVARYKMYSQVLERSQDEKTALMISINEMQKRINESVDRVKELDSIIDDCKKHLNIN